MNEFTYINLNDPRQDVHRIRIHNPHLHRYHVAEKLLPEKCMGLNVLELGGGTGEFSRRMMERKIEVTFVDLNENNIVRARGMGIKSTYRIDLNGGLKLFANSTFDGVVMLEVIEHIVAAEFLLQEIHRVLKSKGFLIISTPNFAFLLNRIRMLFGKLPVDEGYHYRFFNVSSLKKKLINAGFKISNIKFTAPAFFYNFFANRIFKMNRKNIYIPSFTASFFAHTIFIKAIK